MSTNLEMTCVLSFTKMSFRTGFRRTIKQINPIFSPTKSSKDSYNRGSQDYNIICQEIPSTFSLDSFTKNVSINPAGIYLLKIKNRNATKRCEICSKLTIMTPNDANDVALVSLLSTLNIFHTLL